MEKMKLYNKASFTSAANNNVTDNNDTVPMDSSVNEHISILEIIKVVKNANRGKAAGTDGIPYEVLNNRTAIGFLHALFNVCFRTGRIPHEWGKGIINPIPKACTADPRDPLSYRGITLANTMYKLYSSVLNNSLYKWVEDNDKVVDEQNGFRKQRSTVDNLSSFTNLVDTRKRLNQSTFCAFIDLKMAYDFVDRDILWNKLKHIVVMAIY